MPIYTHSGDDGTGELITGVRVPKCDPRMTMLGEIDELNSHLGLLLALLPSGFDSASAAAVRRVQGELMMISGHLAASLPESPFADYDAERDPVKTLESGIDSMTAKLSGQLDFVLPGGHAAAAQTHIARAVCRRCERSAVSLAALQPPLLPDDVIKPVIVYLNRLSDYLFILASAINVFAGVSETNW